MASFKFTQVDWKSSFIVIVPVLLFRELQDNLGTGLAMLFAIGIGVFLELIALKYFTTKAEFHDSYLLLQRGRLGKAEKIPYTAFDKITYSNSTRFLKMSLQTKGNTIKLPPPGRLDQAEELFAWLRTKNPATEFEIIKPAEIVELN